jgi:hypothetical protein
VAHPETQRAERTRSNPNLAAGRDRGWGDKTCIRKDFILSFSPIRGLKGKPAEARHFGQMIEAMIKGHPEAIKDGILRNPRAGKF